MHGIEDPMSNELTKAERAAVNAAHWYCSHTGPPTGTDSICQDCEDIAVALVAAVRPVIYAEIASEIEQSPMFIDYVGREALAHLFRNVAGSQRRALRADNP
jgi:hypothetical protein